VSDAREVLADALGTLGSTLRFHRDMGVEALALSGEYLMGAGQTLREQEARLQGCRLCKLCDARNSIVFGSGNPQADLVVIGEGPGADEDAQGLPFVGRAGQLLTKMLASVGLTRDEVYICNTVKCRPPGNRNPEPEELAACAPFLAEQLAAIQPKVILTLGSVATQAMLKTKETIGRLRGKLHPYGDAVLVPTFHPAFLLRGPGPEYRRMAWDDLKLAKREYDQRRTK
jgi:uracil-DNA glycosylase